MVADAVDSIPDETANNNIGMGGDLDIGNEAAIQVRRKKKKKRRRRQRRRRRRKGRKGRSN